MVRERSSPVRNSARTSGGWVPVLNRSFHRGNTMIRGRGGRLITLFVVDILDSMDYVEMNKLFAKFGVVRDVYLPKKRSMLSKRFGFVRYDCSIAAKIALQRTNGVWLQDKELKVKFADLLKHQGGLWQRKDSNVTKVPGRMNVHNAQRARTKEKHAVKAILAHLPRMGRNGSGLGWPPSSRVGKPYLAKDSYANVVEPWSIKTECSFGRQVWLSCYSVPVHAWNISTFCGIDNHWGFTGRTTEVAKDDDDATGEAADRSLDDDSNESVSFIVKSQGASCAHREGNVDGFLQGSGCEESREPALPMNDVESHSLDNPSQNIAGLEFSGAVGSDNPRGIFQVTRLGPIRPMSLYTGSSLQSAVCIASRRRRTGYRAWLLQAHKLSLWSGL
ncbi:Serine/arginine-rich splicing factor 12 [Dionaea muscipula]